jgi:hypothetical protein
MSATAYQASEPIHSPTRNRIAVEDRAFHDWYRFVLSFPPHLVKHYLDVFDPPVGTAVLDPFCGTGTTLVEGMKLGYDVCGIEANPMAHFASSVKTNWRVDGDGLATASKRLAKRAQDQLDEEGFPEPHVASELRERNLFGLHDLNEDQESLLLRGSISPIPLHRVLTLMEKVGRSKDEFKDIQRLAIAKALVGPVGNLHFGPEVGVLRKKRLDVAAVSIWLENVLTSASDLDAVQGAAIPRSRVYLADSRNVIKSIREKSIGALFTSPPYPNEKDYTRTTRLESVLLGFISNRSELRALKKGLLRSNTRNIYVADTDHEIGLRYPRVKRICEQIEERRKDLGKTSGFERLYWKVTASYFGGMERHLESLKRVLAPGAKLGYVVGDQASYFRIPIKTGEILAEIAESIGYRVVSIDLFRTRLATATKEQLREEVVVLEWPS